MNPVKKVNLLLKTTDRKQGYDSKIVCILGDCQEMAVNLMSAYQHNSNYQYNSKSNVCYRTMVSTFLFLLFVYFSF
jgi:hypothetical protein